LQKNIKKKKTQEIEKKKTTCTTPKTVRKCYFNKTMRRKRNKQKIRECKYKLLELRNPKAWQTTLEIVKREKKCKMLKNKTKQTK